MNNSIVKLLLVCAIVAGAITLVRCDTNVLPTIDPRKITLPSNGLVATWGRGDFAILHTRPMPTPDPHRHRPLQFPLTGPMGNNQH